MFHRLVRKACGRVSRSTTRSPRARLFLKPLEERTVPALFTVTNNNNDLAGSLRQAIIDANALAGADTINFAGSVTSPILLTTGEMTISDDLTITGPGASVLKLDGNAASRIFNINKAGVQLTVNISGLTLTNCVAAARGGAVTIADENVTFSKCDFLGNKGTEGGAINVDGINSSQSNVFLTLDGCKVNNNSTTAASSDGGGINLQACVNLTVRNTTISGNTCLRRGGGIYFLSRGSLVMENSTVSGNMAGGDGGGVYFYDRLTDSGFLVRNSTFSGNSAGGNGGGLALVRPNGVFTFENSTIVNNTATLSGGGIFTVPVSATNTFTRVIVESSVISGNNALGGVDISTDGSANAVPLVARHSAIGDISSISTYIDQGGNLAPGTPIDLGPLQDNGGQVQTQLPLSTSPLINAGRNPSGLVNDSRGTGFPRVSGARADIGAAEVQNDGTPTAAASENNVSVSGASVATITVVYADNGLINFSTLGTGDITVDGPGGFTATPTLKSTTPSVNAASITATYEFTPPGGTWTNDDNGDYTISIAASQVADTLGNFVAAGPNARFQVGIARTFVVNTNADSGLGSLRDAITAANSGFSFGDVITFDSVTFSTQKTISMTLGEMLITKPIDIQGPGSGLLTIDANSTSRHFNVDGLLPYAVKFSGMTLTKGSVTGNGGSINSLFQDITISKSVVTGNAAASGAAVNINGLRNLNSNVFLTIEDSTISNNKTTGGGGAFRFSQSANLIVRSSTISGNQATGRGGVIYFNRCGSLLVENSTVSGNTSGNAGGAIYFYDSVNNLGFNIRNSTFSGNKAASGGGILAMETDLLAAGKINIQNSTITANDSSGGAGGAIRSLDATNSKIPILVESSIISGNTNATAPDISTTGVVTVSASAIGSATGFTLTAGALPNLGFGATLNLGPLQNNGGSTQTHFPGPGSPLRNAGANPLGLANDQRGVGFNRVLDGQADIGAIESTDPTPTAKLTANDVLTVGATEYSFTVTYSDSNTGIDVSTINTGDVTVTGPGGFLATPTLVSVDNPANGTPRTATYKFTPPGGSWDSASELGAYTITMNGTQVFDTDVPTKNSVLPGPLGAFNAKFATTFVVTTTADSGAGSLRQAILNANANLATGPDTITFSFATTTTITLNTAELLITDSVVITGTGSKNLTVARDSAAPQFRIFDVNGPGVITVTISGMTITGGDTAGNAAGVNGSGVTGDGAALLMFNDNVTLDNVAIVNNKSGSEGGGIGVASINNANGGAGTLTIRNSTISSNSANGVPTGYGGGGGGIYFANGGTLNIENSTVSGNSSANWMGGGLYLYGNAGLANYTIRNSTISGNTAFGNGGGLVFYTYGTNPAHSLVVQNSTIASNTTSGLGGGIARVGTTGTATLSSSIVADNVAGFGADVTGDFLADFSLVEDASGGTLTGVSNLVGVDPQLLPLANNGGPTQTHKLQATSPAIDAGNNSISLPADQRGGAFLRTFNDPGFPNVADGTDIGAFELQPIPAPPQVKSMQVNDGSAQRSLVTSIKVTFSETVTFPSGILAAFQLERTANGSLGTVNLNAVQAGSVVTITFAAGGTVGIDPGASLQDGSYKLTIFADKVSGTGGTLDGDGDGISEGNPIDNKSLALHRLFGDADGNGSVTAADFNAFRLVYGTTGPSIFDFNGDNSVSATDFNQFRTRYGVTLMP